MTGTTGRPGAVVPCCSALATTAAVAIGLWVTIGRRRRAALAHDLRGSLGVVVGEVELVLSQPDTDDAERDRSARAVLEAVHRATSRLEPTTRGAPIRRVRLPLRLQGTAWDR